jgi:hypothetical protein
MQDAFAGVSDRAVAHEIALWENKNAERGNTRLGLLRWLVPPASGDVHVLYQDLSARDVGVGLPCLPPVGPSGVIVHRPHLLRPAGAVSLLHRARFFRVYAKVTARCRFP